MAQLDPPHHLNIVPLRQTALLHHQDVAHEPMPVDRLKRGTSHGAFTRKEKNTAYCHGQGPGHVM